jgi:hypothetical protein
MQVVLVKWLKSSRIWAGRYLKSRECARLHEAGINLRMIGYESHLAAISAKGLDRERFEVPTLK